MATVVSKCTQNSCVLISVDKAGTIEEQLFSARIGQKRNPTLLNQAMPTLLKVSLSVCVCVNVYETLEHL